MAWFRLRALPIDYNEARCTAGVRHGSQSWQAFIMRIRVRYFAALRETMGRDDETLELGAGADVAAARATLAARSEAAAAILPRCVAAVNRAYVAAETPLHEGDELVFIPPLGGGSETNTGGVEWRH
jgi:molybdopterin converting factor subunit 1